METELQTQSTLLPALQGSKEYKALTIAEKEILAACLQPNIKNFLDNDLRIAMLGLIGKTHLNCGFKLDETQLQYTIDELCCDLKKYNGTLSFQEIQIAFTNGYKKQYGDFFGLSNATYFGWVNAYTWGVSRANAKKAIEASNKKANEVPEISDSEKETLISHGAIKCFENYKESLTVYDVGNVTYNFLDSKGLIPFTDEVKKEIYKEFKQRLIDNEKMKLTDPASIGKHQAIKNVIKDIETNKHLPAIAESKRVALKRYFDQLIEMEENLTDLL